MYAVHFITMLLLFIIFNTNSTHLKYPQNQSQFSKMCCIWVRILYKVMCNTFDHSSTHDKAISSIKLFSIFIMNVLIETKWNKIQNRKNVQWTSINAFVSKLENSDRQSHVVTWKYLSLSWNLSTKEVLIEIGVHCLLFALSTLTCVLLQLSEC